MEKGSIPNVVRSTLEYLILKYSCGEVEKTSISILEDLQMPPCSEDEKSDIKIEEDDTKNSDPVYGGAVEEVPKTISNYTKYTFKKNAWADLQSDSE